MPCRDYFDDHPQEYFGPKLKTAEEEIKKLKERIAFAESALCATLKAGDIICHNSGRNFFTHIDFDEAGITAKELGDWYREHTARDKRVRSLDKDKKENYKQAADQDSYSVPEGWKLVPINPPDTCITSMAVRSDHGLAIPGYYDDGLQRDPVGHNQRLEATKTEMRQLYEEAIGEGFYKHTPPKKD